MKKIDGYEYEPKTIRGCYGSVANFLKENTYPCDIMTSIDFRNSSGSLES